MDYDKLNKLYKNFYDYTLMKKGFESVNRDSTGYDLKDLDNKIIEVDNIIIDLITEIRALEANRT